MFGTVKFPQPYLTDFNRLCFGNVHGQMRVTTDIGACLEISTRHSIYPTLLFANSYVGW